MTLAELKQSVTDIIEQAPSDITVRENGHPLFRTPLIGVQTAQHPHFNKLQNLIPDHMHPRNMLPDCDGPISVIGIVIPISEEIVRENAVQQDLPAPSWLIGKHLHNQLLSHVTQNLCALFDEQNIPVVVADQFDGFRHWRTETTKPMTTWSQRHVALGCGLGTFGLNGALITASGTTHRITTLVVGQAFSQYARVPDDPFRDCLYLSHNECGACIERCPVGAITFDGHDTVQCETQCRGRVTDLMKSHVPEDVPAYGCALCMCDVPCATTRPEPFQF